jgi:hypothetical protein
MAPAVPDAKVTVNPGGKAPVYWYLASKGHKPMSAPQEDVPAWRLSGIGLTPESSGPSTGHRADAERDQRKRACSARGRSGASGYDIPNACSKPGGKA